MDNLIFFGFGGPLGSAEAEPFLEGGGDICVGTTGFGGAGAVKSILSSIGSCLGLALNLIFGLYGGGFVAAATERGTAGDEERDAGRLVGGADSAAGVARADAGVLLRARFTGSPTAPTGASVTGGGVGAACVAAVAPLLAAPEAPRLSLRRKGAAVVGGGSVAAGVGGRGTANVSSETGGAAGAVAAESARAGAGAAATEPGSPCPW